MKKSGNTDKIIELSRKALPKYRNITSLVEVLYCATWSSFEVRNGSAPSVMEGNKGSLMY